MSELERRIQRLEAAEQVRELLRRYATTVDRLPPVEELGELFTEDAVLINPNRHEGRDAILDYYRGALGALEWSRHYIANSAIEMQSADRARHRGYFLAFTKRSGSDFLTYGDYDDLVVRGEGGIWRFREKGNHIKRRVTLPSDDV